MSRRPVFACGRLGALVLVASLTVAGWPGASGVRIAMWRQRCSARPTRDGSHARMRAEIGGCYDRFVSRLRPTSALWTARRVREWTPSWSNMSDRKRGEGQGHG
jgi:hypothetical protein